MIMVRYWRWWWGSAHLHLIILPYCLSSFSPCLDLERRKCSSPPHSFPPYFIFHADPFSFSNLGNGRNNGWGITRYRGARIWQATLVLGWLWLSSLSSGFLLREEPSLSPEMIFGWKCLRLNHGPSACYNMCPAVSLYQGPSLFLKSSMNLHWFGLI